MRRLLVVPLLALLASACASGGGVTVPAGPGRAPARTAGGTTEAALRGHRIVADALGLRGVPYRNGGADPRGFDCSGLVEYVFRRHGVVVPRQTKDQYAVGARVNKGQIRAGDLLFFSTAGSGASHVAIAIDEDEFVHAPSSGGVVRVERLTLPYWAKRFIGARRVR